MMRSPNSRPFRGNQVYIVVWPDELIVKAGYTGFDRYRKFMARGAVLHQLRLFPDVRRAIRYETACDAFLASIGSHAFASNDDPEAEAHLGRGGGMDGDLPHPCSEHAPSIAPGSRLAMRTRAIRNAAHRCPATARRNART